MPDAGQVDAVVFDIGRVIIQWDLRFLFAKLIEDEGQLDWFLSEVLTEEWHFQHDAGRPLSEMVPELKAEYPDYASHIDAYRTRFLESIPGRVEGTVELIEALAARDVPLYAITNFGADTWQMFHPTEPALSHFRDIVVSGVEQLAKPDPAIFELAASRFGHSAQTMLFIDDNAANIAAADALGWQTHHFSDAARLEHDLRARELI